MYIIYQNEKESSYGIWEVSDDGNMQRAYMYSDGGSTDGEEWQDIIINRRDGFTDSGDTVDIMTDSEVEHFLFLANL